ncbi:uncharacterized protein [Centruroides vittatus]|uniref:uncharacterized protein isoform X1 n=2 Tax=Centruroides vittatus TaxID=120091 RepID=UPI0035102D51
MTKMMELVCGNGIREDEEDCDCGSDEECDSIDPNCAPPGSLLDKPCTVRKSEGKNCSARDNYCCTEDGQIVPASEKSICGFTNNECQKVRVCSGESADCGPLISEPRGFPCAYNTRACRDGNCLNTPCVENRLQDCLCEKKEYACHLCCINESSPTASCKPIHLIPGVSIKPRKEIKRRWYEPCLSYKGVCNDFAECEMISWSSYFYSKSDFQFVLVLVFLILTTCSIILAILYIKIYRKYLIRQFRKECKNSEIVFNERLYVNEEFKDIFFRLITLFPTISPQIILQLIRELEMEYYVAIALIFNSVPIRSEFIHKIDIPEIIKYSMVFDYTQYRSGKKSLYLLNKAFSVRLIGGLKHKVPQRHQKKKGSRQKD